MDSPEPTMTAPPAHSHPVVSSGDHTSLLNVLGWFSVVVIVLVVLTRLGTKWAKSRTVGADDGAVILSTIFAIVQTAVVSVGVQNGLGRSEPTINSSQLDAQQKAVYAFTILFILGQFFAKLSIIAFVTIITPNPTHQRLSWGLVAITCIWMFTSVFGLAFQCDLPSTWKFLEAKCINRIAFYTFVEVFNLVLDSILALFPSLIIYGLQLDWKRKTITIAFFMSRLLVVAASIAQLVVIYSRTEDPFISWTFPLLVMIIQMLGIVTACGPYLKPFLESANSGLMGNDDIRRRHGGTLTGYLRSKESDRSKDSEGSKKSKTPRKPDGFFGSTTSGTLETEESELDMIKDLSQPGQARQLCKTQVSSSPWGQSVEWEHGSQSSEAHIIRQTTSYRVSSETR